MKIHDIVCIQLFNNIYIAYIRKERDKRNNIDFSYGVMVIDMKCGTYYRYTHWAYIDKPLHYY